MTGSSGWPEAAAPRTGPRRPWPGLPGQQAAKRQVGERVEREQQQVVTDDRDDEPDGETAPLGAMTTDRAARTQRVAKAASSASRCSGRAPYQARIARLRDLTAVIRDFAAVPGERREPRGNSLRRQEGNLPHPLGVVHAGCGRDDRPGRVPVVRGRSTSLRHNASSDRGSLDLHGRQGDAAERSAGLDGLHQRSGLVSGPRPAGLGRPAARRSRQPSRTIPRRKRAAAPRCAAASP